MAEETGSAATRAEEIAELKRQMEEMQKRLEQLSAAEEHAADEHVEADSSEPEVELASACADGDTKDAEPVDGQGVAAEVVGESAAGAACADDVSLTPAADASSDSAAAVLDEAPASHMEAAVEAVPVAGDEAAAEAPAVPNAYGVRETEEEYTAAAVADFMPQSDPPQPAPPIYGAAPGYAPQAGQQSAYGQQPAPAAQFGQQPYTQQPGQAAYYQQGGNYYSAPQGGYAQPQGGYQSQYQQPLVRTKDHVAAGLLAIFLGVFGVHKFYLGYNTAGFILLGVTILGGIFTLGIAASVVWLIGIIEGVMYLTKSQPEFEQIYVFNKREWF